MDAAGEVNTIVKKENFAEKVSLLTGELSLKVSKMGRIQKEVTLLVQPRIECGAGPAM